MGWCLGNEAQNERHLDHSNDFEWVGLTLDRGDRRWKEKTNGFSKPRDILTVCLKHRRSA